MVNSAQKILDKSVVISKGTDIYNRIKKTIVKDHSIHEYIAIEIESGEYFIGETQTLAIKKAKQKYPTKQFFLAQIGNIYGFIR